MNTEQRQALSEPYRELIRTMRSIAPVNQDIITMLLDREQAGIAKYGCAVDEAGDQDWIKHALEEAIDLFVYMKKAGSKSQTMLDILPKFILRASRGII